MLVNETYTRESSPAYTSPVTLTEAKSQLNITGTYHDTLIVDLILAATQLCEKESWRSFMDATYTLRIGQVQKNKDILIFRCPIRTIASVKYYNSSNVLTTLVDGTDYIVSTECEPAILQFINIPTVSTTKIYPFEVVLNCGWSSAGAVPKPIKQAILMCVANLYEMRNDAVVGSSVSVDIPLTSKRLLANFRVSTF